MTISWWGEAVSSVFNEPIPPSQTSDDLQPTVLVARPRSEDRAVCSSQFWEHEMWTAGGLNMLTSHHHMHHQHQNTLPVLNGGACRNKVSLFSHQEYFGWYITLFGLHTIWEVSSLRITNQFAQLSLEPFLPPPVQDVLLRPSLEVTG